MAGTEAGQRDNKQSSEAHSDEGLHAVYNYKHLRRKRSSCSHGNTTTFYDHGARPSGLFQLSSLVKTHSVDTFRYTPGFGAYSWDLRSSILLVILTFDDFKLKAKVVWSEILQFFEWFMSFWTIKCMYIDISAQISVFRSVPLIKIKQREFTEGNMVTKAQKTKKKKKKYTVTDN